jgi:hypothetical protein
LKAKKCSQCPYVGVLFKSSPPLCRNCAMVYNATNKKKVATKVCIKAKPIKKVSDKQSKINKAYTVVRKHHLQNKPYCEVKFENCTELATDIHHKGSGSNKRKYFLDATTFVSVCRNCHDRIHLMSAECLYELGLKIRT